MSRIARFAIASAAITMTAMPAHGQTLFDTLAKALKPRNSAATAASGGQFSAPISPSQSAAIDALLAEPLDDPAISAARAEALPLIKMLVTTGACATDGPAWNATNRYAMRPFTHDTAFPSQTLMHFMKYHDRAQCLDVTRITDWKMPANNALAYNAYYVAADSGEAGNVTFELQKGSDGKWLVRQIGGIG